MEREEAIKIVKSHYPANKQMLNEALEFLIPELKDSEDEKIRKALVRFHKSTIDVDGIKGEEIVAWLEKQGEQKVIDKVEPKFKVGDWVVQENIGVYKVIEICESWYEVVDNKDKHYSIGFDKEYMCHLWTIEDAKDGDVLMANAPFIFNGNLEGGIGCPGAHCAINTLGKFQIPKYPKHWTGHTTTPATKEQRDILFAKIKEAGYEWDAEKKELKLLISNGGDFESNNSKQNPTWSEEDDAYELFAISAVEDYYDEKNPLQKGLVDWLKSLKERLS